MNLQRHHVLYGLLTVAIIIALIVLMTPRLQGMSYMQSSGQVASSTGALVPVSSVQQMQFEVVTTEDAQERGLGGRADIPENYGMLFVFPTEGKPGFWMKDMLAPIDMIWLSDNGTILGIEDAVLPSSYPQSFYPPSPIKYVLETRAGESARRGWKVGSEVPLPLPYGK